MIRKIHLTCAPFLRPARSIVALIRATVSQHLNSIVQLSAFRYRGTLSLFDYAFSFNVNVRIAVCANFVDG